MSDSIKAYNERQEELKDKAQTIEQIIKITKVNPENHFDTLNDKSLGYLDKLLKVCKHLAK